MNDFTKEELKFIAITLERFPVKQPDLEKQIQSMIDNYCDHEQSGEVRDIDFIKVCTKCKKVTDWV